MSIKVIIVDDHELIRKGLITLLAAEQDIEVLAEYASGLSLLNGIQQLSPDVIVLDLQLPGDNGLNLLLRVKEHYPRLKVLMLSTNENIHTISLLLKNGANGYLFKDASASVLAGAIRFVYEQEKPFLLPETERILRSKLKGAANHNALTPREVDVLQLIAQEKTSHEIADLLGLSYRTVEIYRLGLMQKLDVRNMVGMVKKAIMLGLIRE